MTFQIGLLGLGTVGSGILEILQDPTQRHPLLQKLAIHSAGVRSLDKKRNVQLAKEKWTTDLNAIVDNPKVDIIVEVMGGIEPAYPLMLRALKQGKHVVTANKAVISRHGPELFQAAQDAGVQILFEAAVGGGIPILQPMMQYLPTNQIKSLTGIINGTTNYILSRMQDEGGDFADILADAQKLGYAEADPSADVDGFDSADKIGILASLGFRSTINREDIFCQGIRDIGATDIRYAEKLGFVIKLLSIAKRDAHQLQIRVHPTLIPKHHPLANIHGVNNALFIESAPLGEIMLFGPGAGKGPTASAVVADLLNLVAQQITSQKPNPLLQPQLEEATTVSSIDELESRFYLRLHVEDQAGVIGHLGVTFGAHRVSLESIVQVSQSQDSSIPENTSELVVVTHTVKEKQFQDALQTLCNFPEVLQAASVIRVL